MTGVFVCCAANDALFARRLEFELRFQSLRTEPRASSDRPDLAVNSREDNFSSIERADLVLFVVSIDGMRCERAQQELERARSLNKPILAIYREGLEHGFWGHWVSELSRVWMPHKEAADFQAGLAEILVWIDTQVPGSFRPVWGNGGSSADFAPRAGSSVSSHPHAHGSEPAGLAEMATASADTVTTNDDVVDCSVFAPPASAPDAWILVQAYFHTPSQAVDAVALAEEFNPGTTRRGFAGLQIPIPTGCILDVEIDIKDAGVAEPMQRLAWRGRAEAVQFEAHIPDDQEEGPLRGSIVVRMDGIPVGRVGFRVMVERAATTSASCRQAEHSIRFKSAFISYASPDRIEVLRRVQALQAVGIAFFHDLLSLDPGARWKPEIYRHIDGSDLFLLFWSEAAKKSIWVRREVGRALQLQARNQRQLPEIRPVILGSPVVLPWDELRHLHFNDRLIFLMEN